MTQILPFLFLGSYWNAQDPEMIKQSQLSHVLTVAAECNQVVHEGVKVVRLIVADWVAEHANQYAIFEEAFQIIDEVKQENKAILVHCMRGRSRSASIVIGYLMTRNKWTLQQAYGFVKSLRPLVGPHQRLKAQLYEYEIHLYGVSSMPSSWSPKPRDRKT